MTGEDVVDTEAIERWFKSLDKSFALGVEDGDAVKGALGSSGMVEGSMTAIDVAFELVNV